MEEKNIKVNLQTALLIIAIIIILIMTIIIGILYNKNAKLKNNGNELISVSRSEKEAK